ncbi:MAG: AEC family transporter [Candidatus Omnitrophota bacterium]|nr:AEC family transporter [Candidatus Omnitrophota bacterium]
MNIVAFAIIKITIIALLGYYLYKKSLIDEKILNFLIFFVINFSVPFLAFSHIIENLKIAIKPPLVVFILSSIAIFLVSFILGFIFSFKRNHEFKKEFISVVSFQNCGYLPLNLALFLFPPRLRDDFIIYTFLYILGFDIIMWSVGSFFIFRKEGERFSHKSLLTPPIIATLIALILVYTNTAKLVPQIIISPLRMVGDTSFALSMIILGCWLAKTDIRGFYRNLFLIFEASLLKLILLPLIFVIIVLKMDISSLFGFFIILQASMPSAVSLPIVANLRKADSEFISQCVLFTHIFSIITVPVWLGLYLKFSHFSF